MAVPVIVTERLALRPLAVGDDEALHRVVSDAETMRWWAVGPRQTLEETRDYVAGLSDKYPQLSCRIVTDSADAGLGWVSLREVNPGVANLGYILNRHYHGRGYGREAAAAIIRHGFTTMGLRRISAEVDVDNAASIALLRSLGFVEEGHLRGHWETHIGVRDSLFFGLLAGEWQGA